MIIKRMKASFGKLQNAELLLEEGMNIIALPNEAGKSTWCAFIRIMLYGINTSERDKVGFLSDKTKYRPWGEYPMEGIMDIVWKGENITLARTGGKSNTLGPCEAFYTGTSELCPELCGKSPGDILIGVPEQVFRRSAFIRRPAMAIDKDTELEKRISALVSSGDEDLSYTEADERLRKWLRKRNRKPTGLLFRNEKKKESVESSLEKLEEKGMELSKLTLEKERLLEKQQTMSSFIKAHRGREQAALWERSRQQRYEEESLAEEIKKMTSKLSPYGKKVTREDIELTKRALEQLSAVQEQVEKAHIEAEKYDRELAEIKRNATLAKRKPKYIAYLAFTGIMLIILNWFSTVSYLWAIGAAFLVASFSFLIMELRRTSRTEAGYNAEIKILESSSTEARERYSSSYNAYKEANRRCIAYLSRLDPKARIEDARAVIEYIESSMLILERLTVRHNAAKNLAEELERLCPETPLEAIAVEEEPEISREEAELRLADITQRLEDVSERLAISMGETRHLGDPLVLGSELERLKAETARITIECSGLELAMEALAQANAELQSRFSPVVSQRAGKLLERMTSGRYSGVLFDKNMQFKVCSNDEIVQRDLEFFSDGTVDQIYLAVRVAVSELILKNDDPCPIVLDDALANFDDERAKKALELLYEMSERRQILFFTCRDREKI